MRFIVQMGQPEQDEQAVHRSADAKICQKTCIFSCRWVQPIKMSKQSAEALLPGCARKHAFLSGGLVFVHIMLLRDQSKGLSSRGHFFSHYGAPAPFARTFPFCKDFPPPLYYLLLLPIAMTYCYSDGGESLQKGKVLADRVGAP